MKRIVIIMQCIIIIIMIVISTNKLSDVEGKIFNNSVHKKINLSTISLKLAEDIKNDIYSAKDTYVGDLTGYIYNCPLCTGRLACKSNLDLSGGLTHYTDPTYGSVRIVASSKNLPCGTIIRINSTRIDTKPTLAIVLDRGVLGTALDLLSVDYDYAINLGRQSVTYDVLRRGYEG